MISTFAAIFPDFSTLARSFASSTEKFPVICERPPSIIELMRGAEYTASSSTMATGLPMLFLVTRAHCFAPSEFMSMLT